LIKNEVKQMNQKEFERMLKIERMKELKEILESGECQWCSKLFKFGEHKWTAINPNENPHNIIKLCKQCFLYLLSPASINTASGGEANG